MATFMMNIDKRKNAESKPARLRLIIGSNASENWKSLPDRSRDLFDIIWRLHNGA